jgi:hypothetical protein
MISLNLFANCSKEAPDIDIIATTYDSFIETFGEIPFRIYLDPNPYINKLDAYKKNIEFHFDFSPIITKGLADGYLHSIKTCKEPYLFQLEYDWLFKDIKHSLDEIIEQMKVDSLYHFRFAKHTIDKTNYINKWCSFAEEKDGKVPYILNDNLTNNPHIIDREYYLKNMIDKIKPKGKSHGIEEELTTKGYVSGCYGRFGDKPTIEHLTPLTKK